MPRVEITCAAKRLLIVLSLCGFASFLGPTTLLAQPSAAADEYFEKHVRPILVERCFECHGPDSNEAKGGLRVDSLAALLQGGETAAAVIPGDPDGSLLIDAVRYGELYQMPPKSRLPAKEVETLTRWVRNGAHWPGDQAQAATGNIAFDWQSRKAEHWAWRLLQASAPHVTDSTSWASGTIDLHLLHRLQQANLQPNAPASREQLARRAYIDLLGLPPSPEEVRRFLADASPDAFAALVDRLLASPRFGERWGRHWLDLMRYAESRGHEFDYDIPNAHEYRDYVIRAFNAGVPYDQFVAEHVAGDLMESPRLHPQEGFNESMLGTGFWFLGEWVHSPVDIRMDEADRFDNMIDVFGKSFLGLTIGCARCHDHKFDAISQHDYHALIGYLQSTDYRQARFQTEHQERQVADELRRLRDQGAGRALAALVGAAALPARSRVAGLLLAARDALRRTSGQPPDEKSLDALARSHGCDAGELAFWVQQLSSTPQLGFFGPWLSQCQVSGATSDGGRPLSELAGTAVAPSELWSGAQVVADYTSGDGPDWNSDGWAFGQGPVRPGEILLGGASPTPLEGVAIWGCVRRDSDWPPMKLAEGVRKDPGTLAKYQRAGQTVRTPTFAIESSRLRYLVRGKGLAYLVVDSHRMLNGPLHGELLLEFNVEGEPTWIEHRAEAYQGHRAHLELVPLDLEPLSLYAVVQGGEAPLPTLPDTAAFVAAELSTGEPFGSSPESMAEGYALLLEQGARWLASGSKEATAPSPAVLAAADWLARRGRDWLLSRQPSDEGDSWRGQFDALVEEYAEQRLSLIERVDVAGRTAPAMWEGSGEDDVLLIRGNPRTPGAAAPRGLPVAMVGWPQPIDSGSGRRELIQAMFDPSNPFPARTMANRVWARLMGRGIVASVDNLGALGQEPSHPELLDYLALRLRDSGWEIKALIREIMLSSAYQQNSGRRSEADQVDPTNQTWHRFPSRRMEAEAIRDSLLSVSGRLDDSFYGPSVDVHLTPFMQGRGRPSKSGPLDGRGRRSIYTAVRRNFLSPMMLAFDMPQPFSTVGQRNSSNVPAQALILLNDPLVHQQTQLWADRLLRETPRQTDHQRIDRLYWQAFARAATEEEMLEAADFLEAQRRERPAPSESQLWASLCHVLVNVKEFIYVR